MGAAHRTISVADAAPMSTHVPLYTSPRGGRVLSIRDDGNDWYNLEIVTSFWEQRANGVPPTKRRQVRGSKKLYYKVAD